MDDRKRSLKFYKLFDRQHTTKEAAHFSVNLYTINGPFLLPTLSSGNLVFVFRFSFRFVLFCFITYVSSFGNSIRSALEAFYPDYMHHTQFWLAVLSFLYLNHAER